MNIPVVHPQAIERETPLKLERFTTFKRMVESGDHRVVLSLGGGAMPGLSGNLALVRILEELGLRPHIEEVWGTSAGAVIGGGWASGNDAYFVLDLVASLAEKGSVDVHLVRFACSILMAVKPFKRALPDGIVSGKAFRAKIAHGLKCDRIEDSEIPFRAVACTDDEQRRTKVFRKGPFMPAIYSSMAIPGVMNPFPGDDAGNTYYDGGLAEKTPLKSVVAEHGRSGDPRKLLVIGSHYQNEGRDRALGFFKRFLATIYVMEEQLWDYQLAEARERKDVAIALLDPHLTGYGLFSFEDTIDAYLEARDVFADALSNAKIVATLGSVI